ncbi:MvdC/MvdD family ATP grasp protein [Microscilla marina]|uniref:Uncharacterized protein n=1 Tax=Microscilla marina ATCC 23134 TaxID=313606 RepID=A1ZRC4_MICM2|nr:hypothetical protein [Microscilla marina]EAY27014.1 conserved hypothetical protein [Microscilla marina ATCC 23134]
MKVLIITHQQDTQGIHYVICALQQQGATVLRFDSDLYPAHIQLVSTYVNHQERLKFIYQGHELELTNFDAVWYRRMQVGRTLPVAMTTVHRALAVAEAETALQQILGSWGKQRFVLDPVTHIRYAENKQLQLKIAQKVGLSVPATLVTNSVSEVRAFAQNYESVISKMQHSFSICENNGEEYQVYSHKWQPQDLRNMEGLEWSPMTFQEYIPKAYELRVVVVGEQVFCGKIPSQQSVSGRTDWRKDRQLLGKITPYHLPDSVRLCLLKLMDFFKLNYGAIDLIRTPEGQYVFLEVNPAGEFCWLDEVFDHQIANAIAGVLMHALRRRSSK